MAVVNQQLEDDNNHGSGGSTSSIDDMARVNASKEYQMAELERVIRLCFQNMWPMIRINQSEDYNNHGAAGSTISVDELPMVSTLSEAEMKRVVHKCKETLWPMICAEINAQQHNLLSVIKEKFGFDLLTSMTWGSGKRPSTPGSHVLQFKFINGISTPVSTRKNIEGKDDKPLVVALVDQSTGEIVTTGAEAATEVEIVVLEGDCADVEAERWACNEFNKKIIREWNGKKVLQGSTLVKLKEGIVCVNHISFTHDASWRVKRKCRLGARSMDGVFVKEAITESFLVIDKRNLKYNKHVIPSLSDEVYRLYEINHRSDRYKRLREANINTVMDLRTLNAIDPERLKEILKVNPNEWKIIMDHARKCKDDKGVYLYHSSRDDDRKRDGVVFNVSGHLVGAVSDSQFFPCDKLSNSKKGDAEKVVVSASEHWEEVVPFKDEASLINHLLSGNIGRLNLVRNPHTNHHLNTPTNINHLKINMAAVGATPTAGQLQSQSPPKRPASEHDTSNSPKKPRDNYNYHQKTSNDASTSTSSEVVSTDDDNEYLKYLNLSEFGSTIIIPPAAAQKWERVWYVVGWISILYSRVNTRRQLLPQITTR